MLLLIYTYNLNALLCARRITHNMCWHPLPASPSPIYSSWWSLLLMLLLLLMLCCRLSSPCFPHPPSLSACCCSVSHLLPPLTPTPSCCTVSHPPNILADVQLQVVCPVFPFFCWCACACACLVYQRFKAFYPQIRLMQKENPATSLSEVKAFFFKNAFA